MKPLRLLLLAALTAFPVFADGVRITFSSDRYSKSDKLPDGWVLKGKLFTAKPTYEVVYDKDLKMDVLRIRADRASGTLLYDITGILQKYPIMRWKWRVDSLPKDADGRVPERDDQALSVYVGAGRISTNSMSYRWDTDTPKQTRGKAAYGAGMV